MLKVKPGKYLNKMRTPMKTQNLKIIKRKQTEILELNSTITETKNSLEQLIKQWI